jgi:hypothetical protein
MHAAHLARAEWGETAAGCDRRFEGKLRCEQSVDLGSVLDSAGLVVIEDDAAVLAKIDAVGPAR